MKNKSKHTDRSKGRPGGKTYQGSEKRGYKGGARDKYKGKDNYKGGTNKGGSKEGKPREGISHEGRPHEGRSQEGGHKGKFEKPYNKPYKKPDDRGRDRHDRGRPDKGKFQQSGPRPPQPKRQYLNASLWGVHAVTEAWLNPARRIQALYVTEQALHAFQPVIEKAVELGLERPSPKIMDKKDMDRSLDGAVHQGIALEAAPLEEVFVQDLVAATEGKEHAVILMLDQVTDPHNVGAILRSACAFGAAGVIMQRRHSPELTGVLAKTASGAAEHIPVAYEINLSDTLDHLKSHGFFAIGLDERGTQSIGAVKKGGKTVLVLGAEGAGLRPKVREHCDGLVCLPTRAPIASLNVSNAAAVALFALCEA